MEVLRACSSLSEHWRRRSGNDRRKGRLDPGLRNPTQYRLRLGLPRFSSNRSQGRPRRPRGFADLRRRLRTQADIPDSHHSGGRAGHGASHQSGQTPSLSRIAKQVLHESCGRSARILHVNQRAYLPSHSSPKSPHHSGGENSKRRRLRTIRVESGAVTCPRSVIRRRLESRLVLRRGARVEQRAIGEADPGCAADRMLRGDWPQRRRASCSRALSADAGD